MWLIRWILGLLVLIVVIGFISQNTQQQVSVEFITWNSPEVALWVVIFFSFASGMIVWLIVAAVQVIQLRKIIRKLTKENDKLSGELDNLRNTPIEEPLEGPEDESDDLQ